MPCGVLRCSNPPVNVIDVAQEGMSRHEVAVCAEHDRRISSGEPYYFDSDSSAIDHHVGTILMGEDLRTRELRYVTDVSIAKNLASDAPTLGPLTTLKLTVGTLGSQKEENLKSS